MRNLAPSACPAVRTDRPTRTRPPAARLLLPDMPGPFLAQVLMDAPLLGGGRFSTSPIPAPRMRPGIAAYRRDGWKLDDLPGPTCLGMACWTFPCTAFLLGYMLGRSLTPPNMTRKYLAIALLHRPAEFASRINDSRDTMRVTGFGTWRSDRAAKPSASHRRGIAAEMETSQVIIGVDVGTGRARPGGFT